MAEQINDPRAAKSMDLTIGRNIRKRRLELGMSQEVLAAKLKLTFQQVQKYEKGTNRVAASRLWDVSKALDTPLIDFFSKEK